MKTLLFTLLALLISNTGLKAQNNTKHPVEYDSLFMGFENQLQDYLIKKIDSKDSVGAIFYDCIGYPVLQTYNSTSDRLYTFRHIYRDSILFKYDSTVSYQSIFRTDFNFASFFDFLVNKKKSKPTLDSSAKGTWVFVHNHYDAWEQFFIDRELGNAESSINVSIDFFFFDLNEVIQKREIVIFRYTNELFSFDRDINLTSKKYKL